MDETEELKELRQLLNTPASEQWFKETINQFPTEVAQLLGEPTLRELLTKKLRSKYQEAGILDYEEVGKTDNWHRCTITLNGKPQDKVIWADAVLNEILIWDKGEEKLLKGSVKILPAQQQTFF